MPHRFDSEFNRTIRRRREELGKTQLQVAEAVGVTSDCITLVEGGRRRLDLDRIPRLADALEMDRKDLCRQALLARSPQFYSELFSGELVQ